MRPFTKLQDVTEQGVCLFTLYRNREGKPSRFIGYLVGASGTSYHVKKKEDAEALAAAFDTIKRIDPEVVPPDWEP